MEKIISLAKDLHHEIHQGMNPLKEQMNITFELSPEEYATMVNKLEKWAIGQMIVIPEHDIIDETRKRKVFKVSLPFGPTLTFKIKS